METCAADECDRRAEKVGRWCEMHYRRVVRTGDPNQGGRRIQSQICAATGCAERPLALDLCRRHYYAQKAAESRAARPPKPPRPTCSIDGCEELTQARGWCGAHYQRWRRFGDPTFVPAPAVKTCTIKGCDGVTNARGLCSAHYYRWQTYGDPLYSKNKPRRSGPTRSYPQRACATCGAAFDPGASSRRKYCSRRCRPGRGAGINKRSTVERLAAEDGWWCRICDESIDPEEYWPSPLAGSVDHRVPVAQGGTDDRENLQLAHLRCNCVKGAGS